MTRIFSIVAPGVAGISRGPEGGRRFHPGGSDAGRSPSIFRNAAFECRL